MPPRQPSTLARTIALALLAAGAMPAAMLSAAPAHAQSAASYDIAPGPLSVVLNQFARQAHVELVYDAPLTQGITSTGLKGNFGPVEGLSHILSGTGLTYRQTAANAFTLERAPVADAHTVQLGPVQVEGDAQTAQDASPTRPDAVPGIRGYVATRGSGATKTDTPLIEVPASISVVTHDQIVDQDAQSVSQSLRYTPGIVAEQRGINEDSLEYLYTRGFQARTFLDGLAIPFSGFNIATRDAYLIDRVESVRGPVSVVYGQTPPGGLVNIVSKQPTTQPLHEVFFETGSYGRARGGFDLGGALNGSGTLSYRLTAVAMTTGTQTDYVRQKRIAVAPAITWRPDDRTSLTVIGNYQKDPEAGAFNYVPAVGTVLPGKVTIPRSLNTGDPGYDRYSKEEESIAYRFEHSFTDALRFRQNFRYLHNNQTIHHVGDGSGYDATGTALTRIAYNNFGTVDAVTLDNQLSADLSTGPLQHKLVVGADFQNTQFDHYLYYSRLDGQNPANLVIAAPVYFQPVPEPNFLLGSSHANAHSRPGSMRRIRSRWGN
jgi:iron complex outermembrane receptor protein